MMEQFTLPCMGCGNNYKTHTPAAMLPQLCRICYTNALTQSSDTYAHDRADSHVKMLENQRKLK